MDGSTSGLSKRQCASECPCNQLLIPPLLFQSMIPVSVPDIRPEDIHMVQRAMEEGWVSSAGPWVDRFEREMAAYCGVKYAVAVSSGTAALHLSLIAAGIEANDWVLLSDVTFVAPANAITYTGARPILVDVSKSHWQMDQDLLADFLNRECEPRDNSCIHIPSGKRIGALVLVHALGYAAPLEPIQELCRSYHIPLIEDAAEAIGSRYKQQQLGSFGLMGCLSFNGNKLLTTGGGGMVLTNEEELAAKIRHLSTQARTDAFTYAHDQTGYNYRMNSMAAALGISQLGRIDTMLARKKEIAARYEKVLSPGIIFPNPLPYSAPNYWMPTGLFPNREALRAELSTQHIQTRSLWTPMHLLDMFSDCIFLTRERVSKQLFEKSLSLPCSVGMGEEELERVIDCLRESY